MLLIIHLLWLIKLFSCYIRKYNVPYNFLATRTVTGNGNMDTSQLWNNGELSDFAKNCSATGTCYFAVYNRSEPPLMTAVSYFKVLSNQQTNCLTYPNCLNFTEQEYQNYSIVLTNTSDDPSCFVPIVETPKCDDDWSSFLRANGKTWCFTVGGGAIGMIWNWKLQTFKGDVTFNQAQEKCRALDANLNGFESEEEYQNFKVISDKFVDQYPAPSNPQEIPAYRHVWLGAMRNVVCSLNGDTNQECADKNPIYWMKNASRLLEVKREPLWYDANGDCFTYSGFFGRTDDYPCHGTLSYYACGKYAESQHNNYQDYGNNPFN